MAKYIVKRVLYMIPTLFVISLISFVIIQLPPGDFGLSFEWQRPVSELIWDRLGLTVFISLLTILVTWAIAIPSAVYVATHQYSFLDYLMSFISFVGLGTP